MGSLPIKNQLLQFLHDQADSLVLVSLGAWESDIKV